MPRWRMTDSKRNRPDENKPNQNEYLVSSSDVLRGAVTEGRAGQMIYKNCCRYCAGAVVASGCAGASAQPLPAISRRLSAELIVPDHAEVAGAVGAAAGGVRQRVSSSHTTVNRAVPRTSGCRPARCQKPEKALALARAAAETSAEARAKAAGALGQLSVCLSETIDEVPVGPEKCLFLKLQSRLKPMQLKTV